MTRSRIDLIGQNGNNGEHYMYFCKACGTELSDEMLMDSTQFCDGCREEINEWLDGVSNYDDKNQLQRDCLDYSEMEIDGEE